MGSGKTHTGRQLARRLNFSFLDLDARIEEEAGLTINEIFQMEGEKTFRRLEAQVLRDCGELNEVVIACGGGTPCFHDNMVWMNRHGLTIYLETATRLLADRLEPGIAHRPLLHGMSRGELEQFIRRTLAKREAFYLQAAVVYHQRNGREAVVDDLARHLSNITGH